MIINRLVSILIVIIFSLSSITYLVYGSWIRVYDHDYEEFGPGLYCLPPSSYAYAYVDGLITKNVSEPDYFLVKDVNHNYDWGGTCAVMALIDIYPGDGNDGYLEAYTEVQVIEVGWDYGAYALAQITFGGGQ